MEKKNAFISFTNEATVVKNTKNRGTMWYRVFFHLSNYAQETKDCYDGIAYRYFEEYEQDGLVRMCIEYADFITDNFFDGKEVTNYEEFTDQMRYAISYCEHDFHN